MTWQVREDQVGQRVDVFIASALGVSRSTAQRLLDRGDATVNDASSSQGRRLKAGDVVQATTPEAQTTTPQPESIELDVVYEDSDLLVINKPRGMVVHPAPGHQTGTLVNAVLAAVDDLSGIGGEVRPGIVHRLDRDTTGLLVVAKNDAAHQSLQAQIQLRTAERIYLAVVWDSPTFEKAVVDAPIGRHPGDRKKMAVVTDPRQTARPANTVLTVLERFTPMTLIEAHLRTGRTHQVRVHCAHVGHPVVGDPLYGGERSLPSRGLERTYRSGVEQAIKGLAGQALHAHVLAFDHPRTGQRLRFSAEPPPDMQALLDALRHTPA
jgi:23S rRNA pseudouridine1911/1915/1917 synthase